MPRQMFRGVTSFPFRDESVMVSRCGGETATEEVRGEVKRDR